MIKKLGGLLLILSVVCSCGNKETQTAKNDTKPPTTADVPVPLLHLKEANRLSKLPLRCIDIEYPNKLSQTLNSERDLATPKTLHPAFYGCFDWHSSVHGHWSLVYLLKNFKDLENAKAIEASLVSHLSKANIEKELLYFKKPAEKSYERTYGWAWLLKLSQELHQWKTEVGQSLEQNLKPLTTFIVGKYLDYLPKLKYPIRSGTHTNTAFGLSFALDYAECLGDVKLKDEIVAKAKAFYENDEGCPLSWEPGGSDFLSPCLEEAALMKRILPTPAFKVWLSTFLPQLKDPSFTIAPAEVLDRSDGYLVHLDGMNFSRAWNMLFIAEGLPEYRHLVPLAYRQINHSLAKITGDDYMGEHWLGTFAIKALDEVKKGL